jgi:predicted DNA-binding WGR domain protein
MNNEAIVADVGVRMRWEKGIQYYEAHLYQDLFGDWVLTRAWGRRGLRGGRIVHTACGSYNCAKQQLTTVQEQQERRGYMLVLSLLR